MKRCKGALAALCLAAVVAAPTQAHHSFASFDMTTTLTLQCTVKEFQWVNPHTWLIVVAPDRAGETQEYRFEGVPPAILTRSGWTEDTVQVGDHIALYYHPHKDKEPGGAYIGITLPNGKRLGTSGSSFVPFTPVKPPAPETPAPDTPTPTH